MFTFFFFNFASRVGQLSYQFFKSVILRQNVLKLLKKRDF